ncbi:MAG: hypothetical protein MJ069_09655 [Salinivirgaceae bacterium]|nr:hypothetical protein [Salinivirgaceae bacterium]
MKTKKLLTIAAMACVALNFTSCKDEEFDLSFENCVKEISANIEDGYVTKSNYLYKSGLVDISLKNNMKDNVKSDYNVFIGTSKDSMEEMLSYYELKPLTEYTLIYIPYIIHNVDTVFGDKKELKIYFIPDYDLLLTADYGDGEIAANIKWELKYSYYDKNLKKDITSSCDSLTITEMSAFLSTTFDTVYKREKVIIPKEEKTCYIKQGGTYNNPDFPAYNYKYWRDGKTIMRYEPIIYRVYVNIDFKVGDKALSANNTINTIFLDKQQCVCDKDLNIYRISKFGNKIWTVDNYIGVYNRSNTNLLNIVSPFWGDNECLLLCDNEFNDNIEGYHIATNKDWEDLESFLGIEFPSDSIPFISDNLFSGDSSMNKYFSTKGAWNELLSLCGWNDVNGDPLMYQGAFNALPIGIYVSDKIGVMYANSVDSYVIKGLYNMCAYTPCSSGATRIITNHGITKLKKRVYRTGIRFVKD